jgi:hypothetical protein
MIYLFWAILFCMFGILLIVQSFARSKMSYLRLFLGIFLFSIGLYGLLDLSSPDAHRRIKRITTQIYDACADVTRQIKNKIVSKAPSIK